MPKLPTLKWKPAPPGRAERLARWFAEWNLVQKLRRENPEFAEPLLPNRGPSDTPCPEPEPPVAPFAYELAKGQIRLMDPLLFVEFRRPIYVALIAEWGPNSFLTSPFGPCLEPATKAEWLTGRPEHALRVLCLWNARTLPVEVLQRSWHVDDLTPQQLQDAWQVFCHATTGAELEDRLLVQVGCPITHPRDPRLAYQEEEIRLFAPQHLKVAQHGTRKVRVSPSEFSIVRGLQPAAESSGRGIRPPGFAPPPPFLKKHEEWSLSLSTGEPQSTAEKAIYLLAELGIRLVLRFETNREMVSIKVRDLGGNPSPTLDGARVLNPAGAPVCVIAGQVARVPWRDLAQGLAISTSDGRVLVPELLT
jgi:hypothetical protein